MSRTADRTSLILGEQDVADLLYVVRLEIGWIEKNEAAREPLERRLVAAQERLAGQRSGRAEAVA